jgi:hypothetical protein
LEAVDQSEAILEAVYEPGSFFEPFVFKFSFERKNISKVYFFLWLHELPLPGLQFPTNVSFVLPPTT